MLTICTAGTSLPLVNFGAARWRAVWRHTLRPKGRTRKSFLVMSQTAKWCLGTNITWRDTLKMSTIKRGHTNVASAWKSSRRRVTLECTLKLCTTMKSPMLAPSQVVHRSLDRNLIWKITSAVFMEQPSWFVVLKTALQHSHSRAHSGAIKRSTTLVNEIYLNRFNPIQCYFTCKGLFTFGMNFYCVITIITVL